jgi:hypothetical protein
MPWAATIATRRKQVESLELAVWPCPPPYLNSKGPLAQGHHQRSLLLQPRWPAHAWHGQPPRAIVQASTSYNSLSHTPHYHLTLISTHSLCRKKVQKYNNKNICMYRPARKGTSAMKWMQSLACFLLGPGFRKISSSEMIRKCTRTNYYNIIIA